jgi:hypothetical protein
MRTLPLTLSIVLVSALTFCSFAAAQVQPEAHPIVDGSPAAIKPKAEHEEAKPKPDAGRKRNVSIALMIVALVAATGITLLVLTILGGSATRRRLRRTEAPESVARSGPLPITKAVEAAIDEPPPSDPLIEPSKPGDG